MQRTTETRSGLATFEDGHVDDSADLGHLVLRRGCWRVLEVAAPPADSGWGSGWGRHAANQWQEHKQPQTGVQHGDRTWISTNRSRFKRNSFVLAVSPRRQTDTVKYHHMCCANLRIFHILLGKCDLALVPYPGSSSVIIFGCNSKTKRHVSVIVLLFHFQCLSHSAGIHNKLSGIDFSYGIHITRMKYVRKPV